MAGFIDYVKDNWKNNRNLFILDNVNMVFGVLAATYLAIISGKDPSLYSPYAWKIIYASYSLSSIAGIIYSVKRKTVPLFVLNACYAATNFFGFYKAFFA